MQREQSVRTCAAYVFSIYKLRRKATVISLCNLSALVPLIYVSHLLNVSECNCLYNVV